MKHCKKGVPQKCKLVFWSPKLEISKKKARGAISPFWTTLKGPLHDPYLNEPAASFRLQTNLNEPFSLLIEARIIYWVFNIDGSTN